MSAADAKLKRAVFIVDDHPLVREWLTNLINQQADLKTCGEASGSAEALASRALAGADIAIVDLSLERGSGIDLIRQIKASHPGVAIIVLSMHDESVYAGRALRAGARGYVMKREVTSRILEAVRCVLGGPRYLSMGAAALLAEKFAAGGPGAEGSPAELLSDREFEVFQALGRGLGTREIAAALHVTAGTVQAFCARIKEKLNLRNATELLSRAIRWHDSQNTR